MTNDKKRIFAVYFSATFSTKRVVNHIAKSFGPLDCEIDITNVAPAVETCLTEDDLLVVGIPVYGGRVPAMASERLNALKGNNTPAVIVCVYGNRDYDDSLLELNDIVSRNGFIPVSAAAVVAEHCIFPEVATNRPDESDWLKIESFCDETKARLQSFKPAIQSKLPIKGNRPYKKSGGAPISPSANGDCNGCGTCAELCPTGAISFENLKETDTNRCISCARCIKVCPQHARNFRGAKYKAIGFVFVKGFSKRKEPEFIVGG